MSLVLVFDLLRNEFHYRIFLATFLLYSIRVLFLYYYLFLRPLFFFVNTSSVNTGNLFGNCICLLVRSFISLGLTLGNTFEYSFSVSLPTFLIPLLDLPPRITYHYHYHYYYYYWFFSSIDGITAIL